MHKANVHLRDKYKQIKGNFKKEINYIQCNDHLSAPMHHTCVPMVDTLSIHNLIFSTKINYTLLNCLNFINKNVY